MSQLRNHAQKMVLSILKYLRKSDLSYTNWLQLCNCAQKMVLSLLCVNYAITVAKAVRYSSSLERGQCSVSFTLHLQISTTLAKVLATILHLSRQLRHRSIELESSTVFAPRAASHQKISVVPSMWNAWIRRRPEGYVKNVICCRVCIDNITCTYDL